MQIQNIWIVNENLICDEILTHPHSLYIISLTDYLVVEGDIYLLQSDIPAYRHRQATSGFDDEFTGRDEGFLPVHHNQNPHKVKPLATFEFFEKLNRTKIC